MKNKYQNMTDKQKRIFICNDLLDKSVVCVEIDNKIPPIKRCFIHNAFPLTGIDSDDRKDVVVFATRRTHLPLELCDEGRNMFCVGMDYICGPLGMGFKHFYDFKLKFNDISDIRLSKWDPIFQLYMKALLVIIRVRLFFIKITKRKQNDK